MTNKWMNEWVNANIRWVHVIYEGDAELWCRMIYCTFGKWSRLPLDAAILLRDEYGWVCRFVSKKLMFERVEYVRSVSSPSLNDLNSLLLNVGVFLCFDCSWNCLRESTFNGIGIGILIKRKVFAINANHQLTAFQMSKRIFSLQTKIAKKQ